VIAFVNSKTHCFHPFRRKSATPPIPARPLPRQFAAPNTKHPRGKKISPGDTSFQSENTPRNSNARPAGEGAKTL
jgi:hypothetical protein